MRIEKKGNNVESKNAIEIRNLSKMYKLYNRPLDRLKDSLGLSRKKLYKEHYALKDVSFDIGEGECVGIIGTNGSGKSTILKIITGVLAPTTGTVTVNGRISAVLELGAGFNRNILVWKYFPEWYHVRLFRRRNQRKAG